MVAARTKTLGPGILVDVLLAQVQASEAYQLAPLAEVPGSGLVVTGDRDARTIVHHLCHTGFKQQILPDRQRYKGKNRLSAAHPFDPDWIAWQRRLGLPIILPDAGYVAPGDLQGLKSVLQRSSMIPGAVALLALANWWLYDEGLKLLLAALDETPMPIAIVIEHRSDPLGVRRVLDGLLTVIRTGLQVIPMRCDLSALGLLAHGALAAAFGSVSALRHLYPQISSGGRGGGPRRESALWPAGLAFHNVDLLHDAVAASPSSSRWKCGCTICRGARLDRLAATSCFEVRQHNLASAIDLRNQLVALPSRPSRTSAWAAWCREAELAHTAASSLTLPPALRHWQR
ncbi:hypothetical protein ACWEVP_07975 [Amycolatopsis sp. NPDC003865]